jgi:hypothetical protein
MARLYRNFWLEDVRIGYLLKGEDGEVADKIRREKTEQAHGVRRTWIVPQFKGIKVLAPV